MTKNVKKSMLKTKFYAINIVALFMVLAIYFSNSLIFTLILGVGLVSLSFSPLIIKCEICKSSGYVAGWTSDCCLVCGAERITFFKGILILIKSLKLKWSK